MARRSRKLRRRAPRRRRGCLGTLAVVMLKLGLAAALLWGVVALAFYAWALTFDLRRIFDMPERSLVLDGRGRVMGRLAGENRVVVPFDQVSNHFVNALLAREDTRFYRHHGIDPLGILRAVVRNFLAGGLREGASTITQQLARTSFGLEGKTFRRKLLEAALAYRIETELEKEEILEAYMNRIYLGAGCYGVEAASQAYFGKPASRMNLAEAAMLAGIIRSPGRFSPLRAPEKAVRERNAVLARMLEVGLITEEQRAQAAAAPPPAPRPPPGYQESWAMEAIESELDSMLERGQRMEGGLRIETTLDPGLQAAAESALARRLEAIESQPGYRHPRLADFRGRDFSAERAAPWLEGAVVVLDARSGAIRAIVGGRDFQRSRFQRAVWGRRQAGSLVKPFIYAAAFEKGLRPSERISDARLSPREIPAGLGAYDPANFDGVFGGELPAGEGLIRSRNTMAVRVGLRAGLEDAAKMVARAGIHPDPPRFPSLCLGAFESDLRSLTAAYTAWLNDGVRRQPYLISRVLDSSGRVLYQAPRISHRVMTPEAARLTAGLLAEVLERGTAAAARRLGFRGRGGGKTGTTNAYQDAWFIGWSEGLLCGVWVGFDQPRPILAGGTGAELALPVWVDVMNSAAAARERETPRERP